MANVFPDFGSSLNWGFRNDSFIYFSAAVSLPSVGSVGNVRRDKFCAPVLEVDRVTFAITFCSFVDGLQ
jgi:hypothetical protein